MVVKRSKAVETVEKKADANRFTLRGTVKFPAIFRVNQMSGKYSLALTNLTDESLDKLEERGVDLRTSKSHPEWGDLVNIKSNFAPAVVDSKLRPVDPSTKVGSDSEVIVTTSTWDYMFKGKAEKGLNLLAVQIIRLVEYEAAPATDLLEEEDGWTSDTTESLFDDRPINANTKSSKDIPF